MSPAAQKLGRNHGGYQGETIDLPRVIDDAARAAKAHGWRVETMLAQSDVTLLAFTRSAPQRSNQPPRRVYLSTGIHGDEPAGPLAIHDLLVENNWPATLELRVCPCLNPTGFARNSRENRDGHDLNRDYRHSETDEVRAHVAWLQQQPAFDLTICLHEDWEAHGFYLYELNPDQQPSPAEAAIEAVGAVCPIDRSSVIEGRPAQGGIIRPQFDPTTRPQWPEAFYLVRTKCRHSFTLEAPSDFPLWTRVAALKRAVQTLLALRVGVRG